MVTQVFMSHTKLDKECCDKFDVIASRVGLKVFRSEFESIEAPAWLTIRDEMNKSSAMFLLIGKELVKAQVNSELNTNAWEKWKYTQNWIAYEVGLSCQQKKDVWVICDGVKINFPVPYLNHYEIFGINPDSKESLNFWKNYFIQYRDKKKVEPSPLLKTECPYEGCKAVYELHSMLENNESIICPTCLQTITYPMGFPSQLIRRFWSSLDKK